MPLCNLEQATRTLYALCSVDRWCHMSSKWTRHFVLCLLQVTLPMHLFITVGFGDVSNIFDTHRWSTGILMSDAQWHLNNCKHYTHNNLMQTYGSYDRVTWSDQPARCSQWSSLMFLWQISPDRTKHTMLREPVDVRKNSCGDILCVWTWLVVVHWCTLPVRRLCWQQRLWTKATFLFTIQGLHPVCSSPE